MLEKYDMEEYDIQSLEENLNLKFPIAYKNILLNYPVELKTNEYGNQFLIYDVKDLLYNLIIRCRWLNLKETLPRNFFPIGYDYGGNMFFINLKDDESIYIIDHDEVESFYNPNTNMINWDIALKEFKPNITVFVEWLKAYLSEE
ncbi:MAG: SMI1/KNR4 family protein [Emticicia sp.]|uniref:SMI1/KNR4 family protein n=1 Tax=Emticicia sp. TaxID=1930953 RepID=UPI003BA5BDA5